MFTINNKRRIQHPGYCLTSNHLDSIFGEVNSTLTSLGEILPEIQSLSKGTYPPYNILEETVEVAVAGFRKDELSVESSDGKLYISGTKKDRETRVFSHKGISEKDFSLVFKLGKYYVVSGSTLVDGILTVKMTKVVPDELKPKKFDIA